LPVIGIGVQGSKKLCSEPGSTFCRVRAETVNEMNGFLFKLPCVLVAYAGDDLALFLNKENDLLLGIQDGSEEGVMDRGLKMAF